MEYIVKAMNIMEDAKNQLIGYIHDILEERGGSVTLDKPIHIANNELECGSHKQANIKMLKNEDGDILDTLVYVDWHGHGHYFWQSLNDQDDFYADDLAEIIYHIADE